LTKFSEISYVIDAQDRIVSIGPEWTEFAQQNGGAELTPDKIIGHPLWKFIDDQPTRELYHEVLAHVREGAETELVLRCDSPEKRRLIRLVVSQLPDYAVGFKAVLLSSKSRPAQRLFDCSTPRTAARVMVCSWCDRVHHGKDEWVEVETAMECLNLVDATELPQLKPVVCPSCYAKVIETLAAATPAAVR